MIEVETMDTLLDVYESKTGRKAEVWMHETLEHYPTYTVVFVAPLILGVTHNNWRSRPMSFGKAMDAAKSWTNDYPNIQAPASAIVAKGRW